MVMYKCVIASVYACLSMGGIQVTDKVRLQRDAYACDCVYACILGGCVYVCYDCYCYANLWGLCQASQPDPFICISEENQGETEQTAATKQPHVDPKPTCHCLSSLSTFTFCHVSTCIQDPLGGRNWDRKLRRKCCLNPSINLKLVYLASFVVGIR